MEENIKYWRDKLENYCAIQERCISDVKLKMVRLKIPSNQHSSLIEYLIKNQFLSEERYVRFFVQSKINVKKDGLEKIRYGLKKKGIQDGIIKMVFQDLNLEIYQENLLNLLAKKWNSLLLKNDKQEAKAKLMRYLLSKGYKYDEFKDLLR